MKNKIEEQLEQFSMENWVVHTWVRISKELDIDYELVEKIIDKWEEYQNKELEFKKKQSFKTKQSREYEK